MNITEKHLSGIKKFASRKKVKYRTFIFFVTFILDILRGTYSKSCLLPIYPLK